MVCFDLFVKVKKVLCVKIIKLGVCFVEIFDNVFVVSVINEEEYVKLIDYNKKCEKVICVDEFDFDMNLLDDNVKLVNLFKSVVNE